MNGRDPHSALKIQEVVKANQNHLEAVVTRLQWGKEDVGYSLHVYPSSYTTSGLQTTDFLAYLGFERSDDCPFTNGRQCYVKWVPEGFDPDGFLTAFQSAFVDLEQADRGLQACGFWLPQPEGWGFFHGKSSGQSYRGPTGFSGDGHTARTIDSMKQTEDQNFFYRFSFIDSDYDKGFVTHYRPKHPPLSAELRCVFRFLGLQEFQQCPEFDFEPCFYRTVAFESHGDGIFDSNAQYTHQHFDAHENQFSSAIEKLLASNVGIESLGMAFLPFEKPNERIREDIEQKIIRPKKPAANTITTEVGARDGVPSNFDVAISVAGPDKEYAQELAQQLEMAGFAVFYYEFYPEYLWGKNLTITFDEIFRKRSRFCVMFVSKNYRDRVWTSHEMRSAQARAVEEKGNEYILPIRIDETELDGLLPTISYLPIGMGIGKIGELLIKKLES